MGASTAITWCDATFNAWRGCTKVSEGCKFCYAETLSKRNPKVLGMWGSKGTRVVASESMWREPLKWNAEAKAAGERRRVFCASLADVFEGPETCSPEAYAVTVAARERLFQMARDTNWLDWLFLTKRPENIPTALKAIKHPRFPHTDFWALQNENPRPNWWFGTSVENQEAADKRIPELLKVPAAVRFLSCEPLLGPVDLGAWLDDGVCCPECGYEAVPDGDEWVCDNPSGHGSECGWRGNEDDVVPASNPLHWVIAGGESGPHARPMHPDWARSLRDQCQSAGVAFHFKQWGEYLPVDQPWKQDSPALLGKSEQWLNSAGGMGFHGEEVWRMRKVGKLSAGRLLDGRTWDELPEVHHA